MCGCVHTQWNLRNGFCTLQIEGTHVDTLLAHISTVNARVGRMAVIDVAFTLHPHAYTNGGTHLGNPQGRVRVKNSGVGWNATPKRKYSTKLRSALFGQGGHKLRPGCGGDGGGAEESCAVCRVSCLILIEISNSGYLEQRTPQWFGHQSQCTRRAPAYIVE